MSKKINILKKKYYISCDEIELISFLEKIIVNYKSDRTVDYSKSFFVGNLDIVAKKFYFTHNHNLGPTPDPDCVGSFNLKDEKVVELEIALLLKQSYLPIHVVFFLFVLLLVIFTGLLEMFFGYMFLELLILFDFKNQKRLMINRFENQLRRYFSYSSEVVSKNRFL